MNRWTDLAQLSLTEMFLLGEVRAYLFEADVVLTLVREGADRQLNLYENATDERSTWQLGLGRVLRPEVAPAFVGNITALELAFADADNNLWDFRSLSLSDRDERTVRIIRNDASFPEPTLRFAQECVADAQPKPLMSALGRKQTLEAWQGSG